MTSNIYKITDRSNNKVYIGQTKRDIYKRFAEHINKALHSDRKNDKALALYIAINNHKPENFYIESLEKVEGTPKQVDEREQYWISYFNSTDPEIGYNLDKGSHIISEACRKAAEKYLFKAGSKLEGKLLENARNNGYKVAKEVYQFNKNTAELIAKYPSIIEASRATGCDRRSIQRQLNREATYKFTSRVLSNVKYIWAYPEESTTDYIVHLGKGEGYLDSIELKDTIKEAEDRLKELPDSEGKRLEILTLHKRLFAYLCEKQPSKN